MDLSKIINNNANIKFASYTGSTTSPSCKSNVKWFVMIDKFQISRKQLNMFPILYGRFSNVRGLQKLNGRDIEIIQ
jgi:carbonic anhydrase